MNIGQVIKEKRKSIGMSAEELASIVGLSPATIYRYENGDIEKFPLDALEPIAEALHTTPAALMGWETDDKSVNSDSLDKQLSEIEFALSGEIHDLSDNEKQDVLDYIRFKKQQKEKKNDPDGSV